MSGLSSVLSLLAAAIKLDVEEMQKQIYVDPGFSKHVHDSDALVLQLQQLLNVHLHMLQLDAHKSGLNLEDAVLF